MRKKAEAWRTYTGGHRADSSRSCRARPGNRRAPGPDGQDQIISNGGDGIGASKVTRTSSTHRQLPPVLEGVREST